MANTTTDPRDVRAVGRETATDLEVAARPFDCAMIVLQRDTCVLVGLRERITRMSQSMHMGTVADALAEHSAKPYVRNVCCIDDTR